MVRARGAGPDSIPRRHLAMHRSPLSPAPVGGGSSRDIPGKAGLGRRSRVCLSPASSHTPDRGDITRGGDRGGNPLPGKENHTGPSIRLPRRSGVLGARARGGRRPGVPVPNMHSAGISSCTALLSPPPRPRLRRSSPAPTGRGTVVVISPERPAGEAIPVPPFAGIIPYAGKDQKAPENTRKPRKRKNRSVSNNP